MRIVALIARILLGLIFLVFGLNKFLQFMPSPELEGAAAEFMGLLFMKSSYGIIIGLIEVVSGILLLIGKYVRLAMLLITPIILNILLFHIFWAPGGLIIALVNLALIVLLYIYHRKAFIEMIKD